MEKICVFCGSSPGQNPEYTRAARQAGAYIAARNLTLVYGGGSVGLMGELADAAMAGGGRVIGVIPEDLVKMELAHSNLYDLRVVKSTHQRMAMMADLADAFIALPGGFGTMEELFEVLTWAQLGFHQKPIGLLNVCGYYDRLIAFLQQTVSEQFVHADHYELILIAHSVDEVMDKIAAFKSAATSKADWAINLSKGKQ
jgi:uncharacterized protein (TIGR00730 family)